MNPDLEALLRAYDAALESRGDEAREHRAQFETMLDDALARTPKLGRQSLLNAVILAHGRWVRQQAKKPSIIPPKA